MSSKVEVLWSPNSEEDFATYGTELRTYTVTDLQQVAKVASGFAGIYKYVGCDF